jgi:FixJ family two-component response regulator
MISIVDDNDLVREATQDLVRSLGHSAASFGSAEEFLESGLVHNSRCLITDVQMPGMSGLELQSRLIADGHRLPIIFMTGYPEPKIRRRALESGALAFLSKPISEEDIVACLARALDS